MPSFSALQKNTVFPDRPYITSPSPWPNEDKILWREADFVSVNPNSPLYKALAGTSGTVYVRTFGLQGVRMAFYRFDSKTHKRFFGVEAFFLTAFEDGTNKVQLTGRSIGGGNDGAYSWRTHSLPRGPVSMLKDGASVRSVATWGGGKASVVANNGPVATGACTDTEADGTLYLGFSNRGGGAAHDYIEGYPSHKATYMCDGFIQDIAFIPDVVGDYGAKLSVGEDGPAAAQPK